MLRLALAQLIAVAVSCSDSAPEPSLRSDAGPAVAGDSPRSGITLTGLVYEFPEAVLLAGAGIGGVEVCEDKSRTCTRTDRHGWFALVGLTPEAELLLVFKKASYLPMIQAMESPRWSTTLGGRVLAHQEPVDERDNAAPREAGLPEVIPVDEERFASISFLATVGKSMLLEPGVQVALDPPSGTGPVYVSSDSSSSLEPPSGAPAVYGIFSNVEPREEGYELVYSYAYGECVRYANSAGGLPPTSGRANAIRVPARGGYTTYAPAAYCWNDRDRPSKRE
jgi:hypothetical protein